MCHDSPLPLILNQSVNCKYKSLHRELQCHIWSSRKKRATAEADCNRGREDFSVNPDVFSENQDQYDPNEKLKTSFATLAPTVRLQAYGTTHVSVYSHT